MFVAMVAMVFTSCKKQEDLYAIDAQIAENSILKDGTSPRLYIYIDVDSAAMNTTLYEWSFVNDSLGRGGYYRVASTGNGLDGDVTTPITWSKATMSEDGLSMSIPVKVGDKELVLKWQDGVLITPDYTTERNIISVADVLRAVNTNFANLDLVYNDTSYYITSRFDTTYYLAWKTEVVYYTQEQIDSAKAALIALADTLHWFNETYPSLAVPDTVRFSTKQQGDGTYKGQVSVPYETSKVEEIKTNHGPLYILNSEMLFGREADFSNDGLYYFHEQTWTEEFYDDPTSEFAIHTDLEALLDDAKWTPVSFVNIKKFNILLKGEWTMALRSSIGGVEQEPVLENKEGYFLELPLSGFNRLDGEVVLDEHKYKTK